MSHCKDVSFKQIQLLFSVKSFKHLEKCELSINYIVIVYFIYSNMTKCSTYMKVLLISRFCVDDVTECGRKGE